jgi:hypothetical protein
VVRCGVKTVSLLSLSHYVHTHTLTVKVEVAVAARSGVEECNSNIQIVKSEIEATN